MKLKKAMSNNRKPNIPIKKKNVIFICKINFLFNPNYLKIIIFYINKQNINL